MAFKMLKIKSAQMKRSFVFEEFIYEYLLRLKEIMSKKRLFNVGTYG